MHPHHHDTPPSWIPEGPGGRRRGRGGRGGRFGGGPGFGGPGGFGGPPFRGGHRRARRGDVRAAILALLTERPMHGYEIIGELDQRTEGAWRPSPGSVYPTLQMLEEEGLLVAEEADGKRRFGLSDTGKAEAEGQEGPPPWEALLADSGAEAVDLREAMGSTIQALKQVFRVGTPAQQARATEVLADTRRRLYEILASDEAEA
ncbi:MAG TPA: PadR family transcriptional regulator [Iamia sp.]|nr:PadR family transcriptional regulator [Iamia sp.]